MAGGKQTPRQKMVNLMYLVFIAMMALNMSKEVLSAFGLMNEKFESVNTASKDGNNNLFSALEGKAADNAAQYAGPLAEAKKVKTASQSMFDYIESLKSDITKEIERNENGKLPYEAMDKGDAVDVWFAGDGYSAKGNEIVKTMEDYKASMLAIVGKDRRYAPIATKINAAFSTADIKDGEGVTKKYLDYHFKGFPSIATLAKLSALQNDVKSVEQDVYNAFMGNTAAAAASMKNYKAIVITDKSAFFSGEPVTGKVVLGRYDESTVPTNVVVNGSKVDIANGMANFKFGAAGVGEHDIKGKFTFMEDGKAVDIDIEGNYVVVPKPNSATISADKMNSVYRGVTNPMTISFAGVSDDKVTASAPGLSKAGKAGTYNWNVTSVSGTETTVNVTAKLPDGSTVSDKKKFIIRDIPRPAASVRGLLDQGKGNKNDFANSSVSVQFPGFVFDVTATVTSFEVYVPGSPGIIVQGSRFNDAAQKAISRAQRGDKITIQNVKTTLVGAAGYTMKGSSPFIWEVQ